MDLSTWAPQTNNKTSLTTWSTAINPLVQWSAFIWTYWSAITNILCSSPFLWRHNLTFCNKGNTHCTTPFTTEAHYTIYYFCHKGTLHYILLLPQRHTTLYTHFATKARHTIYTPFATKAMPLIWTLSWLAPMGPAQTQGQLSSPTAPVLTLNCLYA